MVKHLFWARPITTKSHFFRLCLHGKEQLNLSSHQVDDFMVRFIDFETEVRTLLTRSLDFKGYSLADSGDSSLMFAAKAYQQAEGKHNTHFYRGISAACDAVLFTPFPELEGSGVKGLCIGRGVASEIEGAVEANPNTPVYMIAYKEDEMLAFVRVDWVNKMTEMGEPITILDKDGTLDALSFYGYESRSK